MLVVESSVFHNERYLFCELTVGIGLAQKWYQKASVQAAIAGGVIVGLFGVWVAWLNLPGGGGVIYHFGTPPPKEVLLEISLSRPSNREASSFDQLKLAMQSSLIESGYAAVSPYESVRPGTVFRLSGGERYVVAQMELSADAFHVPEAIASNAVETSYELELTLKDLNLVEPLLTQVDALGVVSFQLRKQYIWRLDVSHPDVQSGVEKIRELTQSRLENAFLVLEVLYGQDSTISFTSDSELESFSIGDPWPSTELTHIRRETTFTFATIPLGIKVVRMDTF